MAVDQKFINLVKFLLLRVLAVCAIIYAFIKFTGINDILRLIGVATILLVVYVVGKEVYNKVLTPPRDPLSYGKWAIVTGSTSGIGYDFADYLAGLGMNVLLTSRTESKLAEQKKELMEKHKGIQVDYLAFDYTKDGKERKEFYEKLDVKCKEMHSNGGIGVLVNNVGISNEIPMNFEEFTVAELENMLNCNVHGTVFMTRAVFGYMRERKNGAIINISSGSGNHPTPMLSVYAGTKGFITSFSRSMHVECWGTGVDFLVATPYYVVSGLYKRKEGTLIGPMPIKFIKGTMNQLGKQNVWQTHGYWFHSFIGHLASIYPGATARYRKMMKDNRQRYDERQAQKANKDKSS